MNDLTKNEVVISGFYKTNYEPSQLRLLEVATYHYGADLIFDIDTYHVLTKHEYRPENNYKMDEYVMFTDEGYIKRREISYEVDCERVVERSDVLIMTELEYEGWGNYGLKYEYENICNKYIDIFAEKHSLDKIGWVNRVGGIYNFGSKHFSFIQIMDDIENNKAKH